jgi:hypothetical protein
MMPAAAPSPTQQTATAVPDAQRADAHNNMLRIYRRLHQLVDGELTHEEAVLVNRVGWQFGRQASDAEIEAVTQRLANEFEPASAAPLLPAESS